MIRLAPLPDAGPRPFGATETFKCADENSRGCVAGKLVTCKRDGEFLEVDTDDCASRGQACDAADGCIDCVAGSMRCKPDAETPGVVQTCATDHTWNDTQSCDDNKAEICRNATCVNVCDAAAMDQSYEGCDFYAVDLDNAAISQTLNAAAQQYAVVVANPQPVVVDVYVEQNEGPFGGPVDTHEVARLQVAPGDLEIFRLPERHVDGSTATGVNDGTNSALSSNAYHVVASRPITAYQFNPLENVNVFSNGASLLLPTPTLGSQYTVASWSQTIANTNNPEQSFDGTSTADDLRTFLTIVGTASKTHVTIQFGKKVVKVIGVGPIQESHGGDSAEIDIGPFDVVNLETEGFNADFTNSIVSATQPVGVYVGSEASDAPTFTTYAMRQCCGDHLEEQLIPDNVLGANFVIPHQPSRAHALNRASADGKELVGESDEPEWVRIASLSGDPTMIETTLPPPNDAITLKPNSDVVLPITGPVQMRADHPVTIVDVLASQQVTGIPSQYPGGDPSLIIVPPSEQFRRDYVFLTPDTYAFNFVEIVAPEHANVQLDGASLSDATCTKTPVPDLPGTDAGMSGPSWVTYGCQLSFPSVTRGPMVSIKRGDSQSGSHSVLSDMPVGIVVSGFDRFVGYAYVGGLNLDVLR